MKQPALRQYRRELLIHFPKGHAARNLLLAEFDRCLSPLLEELPDPSYQDLTAAFGTPEHMADTLADSVSVPPPFSRKKLAGIIGGVCVVVLCVALFVFAKSNVPEEQIQLETTPTPLTAFLWERVDSYDLAAQPIQWDQPKGSGNYLLLLRNDGTQPLTATIQYGVGLNPHTLNIPAQGEVCFTVKDARAGRHTVHFETPEDTPTGTALCLIGLGTAD